MAEVDHPQSPASPVPRRDLTPVEVPHEVIAKSASGAARTTLVGLLGRGAGLLTTVLVTHFVSKDEYGHANLAMIVAAVLNMLTLLSPQQVLLTRQSGYDRAARVAGLYAAWSGLLVGVLLWLLGPRLLLSLGQPEATGILRVYCVALVLERVAVIPALELRYRLRFGEVARLDLLGDLSYVAVTVGSAAFLGAGGYSLALGMVARHGVRLVVLVRQVGGTLWPFVRGLTGQDWTLGQDLLRDALPLHLGGASEFLTLYLDNVWVGKLYQAAGQGLYAVAYTLVMTPTDTIALYGATAMVRALGVPDGVARRRTYLLGLRYVCLLLFPIGVGVALVTRTLEVAFLPLKWQGLAPIVIGLCGGAVTTGIARLAFAHLTALHRNRQAGVAEVLRLVLFLLALMAVGLWDLGRQHLSWVGWGVSAAFVVSSLVSLWLSLRADELTVLDAARAMLPAAVGTAVMGAVLYAAQRGFDQLGFAPSGARLLIEIGLGAAVFIGYMRLVHRPIYQEALGWVRARRG